MGVFLNYNRENSIPGTPMDIEAVTLLQSKWRNVMLKLTKEAKQGSKGTHAIASGRSKKITEEKLQGQKKNYRVRPYIPHLTAGLFRAWYLEL
jgi:hypothetical protein